MTCRGTLVGQLEHLNQTPHRSYSTFLSYGYGWKLAKQKTLVRMRMRMIMDLVVLRQRTQMKECQSAQL
jgi:hypothetical protein